MKILVAGGAGFIGSHTIIELIEAGHDVICVDNLFNAKKSVIDNIKKITGKQIKFYQIDCCDKKKLTSIFKKEKYIDAVMMFQGYKAVGESVAIPLEYYKNNIISAMSIIEVMKNFNVKNVMFSSSATVYGNNSTSPISENDKALSLNDITNPYGETKAMIEKILFDEANANKDFKVVILRYFNPVGAHKSGLIGEDPNGKPNNLMPIVAKVAVGKNDSLNVYGNDYDTNDGTCIRDFIHVVDLAKGHVLALKCFLNDFISNDNKFIYNLGTGIGTSVLELINSYEKACGHKINYKITDRRVGDVAKLYCNPEKAKNELGWVAKLSIDDMCIDSYRFEVKNNV